MQETKQTKFYVRSGNAFENAPCITAASPKDAAVKSVMNILNRLTKIAQNSASQDEINAETNKFVFARMILVSETGTEKLSEYIEDAKTRLSLPDEFVETLSEEWKKNHENDAFFEFSEIKSIAMDLVVREMLRRKESNDFDKDGSEFDDEDFGI